MESKAHSKESYVKPGQISWMEQDLSYCSRNFKPLFQERDMKKGSSSLPQVKDGVIHVGVIGAGLAGLRCAEILIEHGLQVTLLEARNRLGGRVS
jgi:NADPH-dependent 2,4-dienoyl-CoA reductase/sulfur reductase-like enzyme